MRKVTLTWVEEYNIFEVGDVVRPCSSRSSVPDGRYVVTNSHTPLYAGDMPIVFLEGHRWGVDSQYLDLADEEEAYRKASVQKGLAPERWWEYETYQV